MSRSIGLALLTLTLAACAGAATPAASTAPSASVAAAASTTAAPTSAESTATPSGSASASPSGPASASPSASASATPSGSSSPTEAPSRAPTAAPTAAAVQPVYNGPAIKVLGTENFYADMLSQIGGVRVTATSLLNDPNADPHSFEADPAAAKAVADGQLVIVNGIGYDDFMQKLLAASPSSTRQVVNVQQSLGLGSDVNAHVWYGPLIMPAIASFATEALVRMEPQNVDYFQARKQAYLSSLRAINDEIAYLRSRYAGTPVAFTEPVAGYQAAAIGFTVLTPEGFQKAVEQGVDPSPADVAAERDLMTGHKVKLLLYNSQTVTPLTQSIRDLAKQNGIPVVGVAETIPPQYATYQDWMLGQLAQMQAALGG